MSKEKIEELIEMLSDILFECTTARIILQNYENDDEDSLASSLSNIQSLAQDLSI